jgi:hypothetical protein
VSFWTACDGGNKPPMANGEFSGVFMHTVDQQPFEEDWVFNISERSDGTIEGSGMQGEDFIVVTGYHYHPTIVLEFEASNDGHLGALTGILSDDGNRIDGTYTLRVIFNQIPVTLRRTG